MARIVALDVGDRRIGIAISDETRLIAIPHSVYERVGYKPDTLHMQRIAVELDVEAFIIGLPLNMDGSVGFQAEKTRAFADKLMEAGLTVRYWDERLTTVSANSALLEGGMRREQRKKNIDKVAAALLLQSYLDRERNRADDKHPQPSAGFDIDGKSNRHNDTVGGTHMNKDNQDLFEDNQDEMGEYEEEYTDDFDGESNIIELTDENGVETQFEYLSTIEYENERYIVLMLLEDDELSPEDEGEVVILKIEQDEDGEDMYVSFDDEDISQAVFDLFMDQLEEEDEA